METVMLALAILVLLVQLVLLVLLGLQVPQVLRELKESKAQWDLLVHKDRKERRVLRENVDLLVRSLGNGSTQ